MGSMSVPLPLDVGEMLSNDWHVMGNFMYPAHAPARLAALAGSGQLDLRAVRASHFPLAALEDALDAATRMQGLDLTVLSIADG
jgi:alcohol dehydrogenase